MPSGLPAGRRRYFRDQHCCRQLFQTQLRAGRVQCQVRGPAKGLIPIVRELGSRWSSTSGFASAHQSRSFAALRMTNFRSGRQKGKARASPPKTENRELSSLSGSISSSAEGIFSRSTPPLRSSDRPFPPAGSSLLCPAVRRRRVGRGRSRRESIPRVR